MLKFAVPVCAAGALAFAQTFAFMIGSPVASQDFQVKTAAFVFRTTGCSEAAKTDVGATAEGLLNGARQSVVLKVATASKPGVYAVFESWPRQGQWVVNLKGSCGEATAGAIVPVGPHGFVREASKFFPRAATGAEIDAALKAFPQGGYK